MRVLLFGANGFLGGQVRRVLAGDGRITSVTCPGRDDCDLVRDDVAAVTDLVRRVGPDAVVNCTGRLSGSGHDLVLANTAATAKLIEAVAAAAPVARLVRLGSAAEYGVVPHGAGVAEHHACLPVSEYGTSHLAGTRLLELASAADRVDGLTLRVFNPVGAGPQPDNLLGQAAAHLRHAVATGADEVTLGPLSAFRDFVDVRDVATAVQAAVTVDRPRARVFNVASGRAVRCRAAVLLLAEAAGFTGAVHERGAGSARSAAVGWMRGDIGLARTVLAWQPVHDLADSLRAMWSGAAAGPAQSAPSARPGLPAPAAIAADRG